jgi:hypothetical protein
MAVFNDELTKIRRYLRDINGDIWSDEDIRTNWNDAQHEISMRSNYKERVHTYKYPPEWIFSYMRDWEWTFADGDRYQCLMIWQARDWTVCYPWESGYSLTNNDTPDDGHRFTHPWESAYCDPADVVEIPLHKIFQTMKFLAYDEDELRPMTRKQITNDDQFYKTVTGTAVNYWRPDEYRNTIVIYPRPSNITWDDVNAFRSPLDTFDDAGGINTWSEAELDEQNNGIILDTIETEGQIFAVFDAIPNDVSEEVGDWYTDEIDFPDYLLKYVRYATLERCFGANTDGFIPSLRDYWALRKEAGINAIKRFKTLRDSDREFRLGPMVGRRVHRHPRLPAGYPAVNP